jgi:hypothetical protein
MTSLLATKDGLLDEMEAQLADEEVRVHAAEAALEALKEELVRTRKGTAAATATPGGEAKV